MMCREETVKDADQWARVIANAPFMNMHLEQMRQKEKKKKESEDRLNDVQRSL